MPGLTVWVPAPDTPDVGARFRRAQDLVVRATSDRAAIDSETTASVVGHAGHQGYPVRTWRSPSSLIVFEGRIYDRTEHQLEQELTTLFEAAFSGIDPTARLADFVASVDGDYLVVGATPDGDRVIAFCDALGRLPVYLHSGRSGLVLSRECKVIASLRGEWALDRLGLGQTFWLGYPLGERTLFDGIERMPEGFILDIRRTASGIGAHRSTSWTYRCDRTADAGDLDRAAADVAEQFATATIARANSSDSEAGVIISASGGNNSRAVMAAVAGAGLQTRGGPNPSPIALTFRRADGGQASDVRVAQQVARHLGLPWEVFDLPSTDPADELALIWMKDGLNGVGITYLLPFLNEISRRWTDRAVILTGDGGDKVFPDLRPLGRPRTVEAAAGAIVADASTMEAGAVERLIGLPAGTLLDDLCRRLDAYPELAPEDKGVRFQLTERGRKWLFEGEDRNRGVAWGTTPFYALSVFAAAMAVPATAKTDYRFYAGVQRRLNPILVELPHADFGLPIISRRFYARQAARRLVLRGLGSSARPLVSRVQGKRMASTAAIAETLAMLDDATARRSMVLEFIDPVVARSAISETTGPTIDTWRTVFLLDRLWAERILRTSVDASKP